MAIVLFSELYFRSNAGNKKPNGQNKDIIKKAFKSYNKN